MQGQRGLQECWGSVPRCSSRSPSQWHRHCLGKEASSFVAWSISFSPAADRALGLNMNIPAVLRSYAGLILDHWENDCRSTCSGRGNWT
jgi:hypothetical protein